MATCIPSINQLESYLDNAAERRVAKFLDKHLGDECIVWCNIPMNRKHRYADFLVLIPQMGLLCLEVKDWHLKTIGALNKNKCTLNVDEQIIQKVSPLIQARTYINNVVRELEKDAVLQQKEGEYAGNLVVPYAYGTIFTHFSRGQLRQKLQQENAEISDWDNIFPYELVMYQDDLAYGMPSQEVKNRLARMFINSFPCHLNREQIDRIRWHLFPEIRISTPVQQDLFAEKNEQPENHQNDKTTDIPSVKPITQIPEIVKVMDMQQELIARMMGDGHRVIHGVAGSGKTLILGLRAQILAERTNKPILILCYNITLAAKLRVLMQERGLSECVQVHHFHGWCGHLVKQFGIQYNAEEQQLEGFEKPVYAVLRAVANGSIPKEQYGAILIDEGHDFEADWLRLIVQMLDKSENHLLLLYDDAQSIYPHQAGQKGIKFSLSSVGIEARGRTVKLANNYRNTKQIIGFAHIFAQQNLTERESDEDNIPTVEPCAVGADGYAPFIKMCQNWQDELTYLERCLKKWQQENIPLNEIAIICANKYQCKDVCNVLNRLGLAHWALQESSVRKQYNPRHDKIAVLAIPSSKGLEFSRVLLMGAETLIAHHDDPTRLIYVAMTRAQSHLIMTLSGNNAVVEHIQNSFNAWKAVQAA